MGVNDDLGLRLPEVEWSYRANAGELHGLDWVDTRLDPALPPARAVGENGTTRFRHFPHLAVAPPYVVEDTLIAQGRGRPTAWEGLALLFSRVGWTVSSRGLLWAPYSAYPGVLSKMVEAFGVERAMHRFDPENLSRLAAMLPSWYPSRGRLDAATQVLGACGVAGEGNTTWGQDTQPPDDAVREEVLCCHTAEWWRARTPDGGKPAYRISGGLLRFQPEEGEAFGMRREDFLVVLPEKGGLSLALHRLLPAWAAVRITTTEGGLERPAPRVGVSEAERAQDAPGATPDPVQDALVPVAEDDDDLLVLDDEGDLVDLEIEAFDLLEVEDVEDMEDVGESPTEPLPVTDPGAPPRDQGPKKHKPGRK